MNTNQTETKLQVVNQKAIEPIVPTQTVPNVDNEEVKEKVQPNKIKEKTNFFDEILI